MIFIRFNIAAEPQSSNDTTVTDSRANDLQNDGVSTPEQSNIGKFKTTKLYVSVVSACV